MSCWLFTVATTRLPSDCRVPITEVACCRWCRLIFNSRDVHSGCPSTRLAGWRCRWSSKVNRHAARITRQSDDNQNDNSDDASIFGSATSEMSLLLPVRGRGTCLAWPRSWPPDRATSSIVQVPNSQFQNPDLPLAPLVPLKTSETSPKKQNETYFVSFFLILPLHALSHSLFVSLSLSLSMLTLTRAFERWRRRHTVANLQYSAQFEEVSLQIWTNH